VVPAAEREDVSGQSQLSEPAMSRHAEERHVIADGSHTPSAGHRPRSGRCLCHWRWPSSSAASADGSSPVQFCPTPVRGTASIPAPICPHAGPCGAAWRRLGADPRLAALRWSSL